jgi:hypothetical protein
MKDLYKLLEDRSMAYVRVREIESFIITELVDSQMTEFFTINWRKLYSQFGASEPQGGPMRKVK